MNPVSKECMKSSVSAYEDIDVSIENSKAKAKLAGTLCFPVDRKPYCAVLLVSGIGPNNRNEIHVEINSFQEMAIALVRRGVAVLRIDKRGVGGSEGDYNLSTIEDFAQDARLWFRYLKSRVELDGIPVGIIGHSEGGIVASMVASENKDVSHVVLMAAPGIGEGSNRLLGTALIHRAEGVSEKLISIQQKSAERVMNAVRFEKDDSIAREDIQAILRTETSKLSSDERKWATDIFNIVMYRSYRFPSPAVRYLLEYAPERTLEKVKCPVLILHGEKDLQLPWRENISSVESALKNGNNMDFKTEIFPGLNHLFQECDLGIPAEYYSCSEVISAKAIQSVGNWLCRQNGILNR
jgi:uncharacterized protein